MKTVKMYKLFAALILSVLFPQTLTAATYTPDDFAHTAILSNAETSLRQLDLPMALYEKMQRDDYGDLRVFNADGQSVPHQFSRLQALRSTQETPLVFYPFSKEQAANPGKIQVIINQKADEQKLSINQQLENSRPAISKEYQYIIENPKESPSLCKLRLDWTQSKPSMILALKLESSAKLQNWKTLSRKLTVSRLNYGGSQLTRNEISFPCTTQKHLRLTWLKPDQQTHLNKIHGIFTQNGKHQMQWKSLGKPRYDNDKNVVNWLFESNVIAAISKMEFVAPQDGLLYKGALYSRNNKKEDWRFHKGISQYRLNIGDTNIQSDAITLTPNNDRYWKLAMATEGLFSDSQFPEVRVGWAPRQLHFLAQGKGPFQLAFGNPAIKPAQSNNLNALIQSLKQTGASAENVTLGQIHNNEKSFVTKTEMPWKLILLWLVLIMGTALMAFMAYRLYQQMGEKQEKK